MSDDLVLVLGRYGDQIDLAAPPISIEEVREGHRTVRVPKRVWIDGLPKWVFAAAAAAAVLVLFGGLALLLAGDGTSVVNQPDITMVVPSNFECPTGSTPDVPGPADQARPQRPWAATFDTESGVVVASTGSETWLFDICTNTWELRSRPATSSEIHRSDRPQDVGRLMYHPGEDLTIALTGPWYHDRVEVWTYDVNTDMWTELSPLPSLAFPTMAAVDTDAGLLVAGSTRLYTFDVRADEWTPLDVRGAGLPSETERLMAYDPTAGGFVVVTPLHSGGTAFQNGGTPLPPGWVYGATSILDPSGSMRVVDAHTQLPEFVMGDLVSGHEITFDEVTGRVAVYSSGKLIEYDATSNQWLTLYESDPSECDPYGICYGPLHRGGSTIVYDPTNSRILLIGGNYMTAEGILVEDTDEIWAFNPDTAEWDLLLEPTPG